VALHGFTRQIRVLAHESFDDQLVAPGGLDGS
jgi:hypothetical protein